jgi:hypothetical protein
MDSNYNFIENGKRMTDTGFYHYYAINQGANGIIVNQGCLMLQVDQKLFHFVIGMNNDSAVLYGGAAAPDYPFTRIHQAEIDRNANNGAGAVINKKLILDNDSIGGFGMYAVRHANGRYWWLFKNDFVSPDSYSVYRWLVTDTGASEKTIIKLPPLFVHSYYLEGGWGSPGITFSDDGTKIIIGGSLSFYIADFNRCTGNISNVKRIVTYPKNYTIYYPFSNDSFTAITFEDSAQEFINRGIEFSKNKKFVYLLKPQTIWQWEIDNPDTNTAWVCISKGPDTNVISYINFWSTLKLGPDNRIYIGALSGNAWSVIDSPDNKGVACNLRLRYYHDKFVGLGLYGMGTTPNNPNYNLGKDESVCWPVGVAQEQKTELSIYHRILVVIVCNSH